MAVMTRVLHRERIDHSCQHPHVVGLGPIHSGARAFETSEDVPASDDEADLHAERMHLA
jgi:hypothetical protein